MEEPLKNCTTHSFHLMAFSQYVKLKMVFFLGILLLYLLAVLGNVIIALLICLVPQLHTPMYAFLCNLSVQDTIYVSATLPKFLSIAITGDNSISFQGCITQMFLFTFCVGTDFFLLTSMAYDRYVAICSPLHYSLIINKSVCVTMIAASWIIGILNSLTHSLLISNLSFCVSQDMDHFYCDLKMMIKLSSSNTTKIKMLLSVECIFLGFLPFMLTLTSYVYIISTILKIRTSKGRMKAFSSCSSHLTVVFLFYGTSLSFYVKPESEDSQEEDTLLSLLYTAVVPMLNPLVYSLRNQDVWKAIKNTAGKCLKPMKPTTNSLPERY
ncbi:olfactory receptor 1G1-like [Spea bombifrons]|uniref:olfactory receptor 1G1-like n=1 Tax=Spea bombifrons TaxID=233779 RepID=UPI00234955F4|nr:olfactory receptor 1G1-like [Spea bombifrons]